MRCSSFALVLVFTAWLALAQNPGAYTPTENLTRPRTFHTATLLPDGKVLLAGGSGFYIPTSSAELYDPPTGTFTATGDMTTPRSDHTATLLPDGKVLITGGPLASAELYDPSTGSFMATGSMTVPRNRHIATLLHNGRVLIVGGGSPPYQSAELYDPSTGTFTATGDMTEPGAETATLLPNGKVLITKSVDYCYDFAKPSHAELYDPSTGTFARTGDMVDPLQGAQPLAILLMNGKVLIAGGDLGDFGGSTSAEIYDPAAGVFTGTGKMTADIDKGAATLLPDGGVFISGTSFSFHAPDLAGATELYDPASGAFGAPIASRPLWGQTATMLPDGTVLQRRLLPGCGGRGNLSSGGTRAISDIFLAFRGRPRARRDPARGDGTSCLLRQSGSCWRGSGNLRRRLDRRRGDPTPGGDRRAIGRGSVFWQGSRLCGPESN